MKEIIEYQCEICKNKYKTKEEAIICEKQGLFDFNKYPIGLLCKINWENSYGIFVNAQNTRYFNEHLATSKMWAYRSWENLPEEKIKLWNWDFCGSGFRSRIKQLYLYRCVV